MMSSDVALSQPALVGALAAWATSLHVAERRNAATLAALDARALADEVSAGGALVDHALRAEVLRDVERVRREREDLHALCSSWSCRPWPTPPVAFRSSSPTERTSS